MKGTSMKKIITTGLAAAAIAVGIGFAPAAGADDSDVSPPGQVGTTQDSLSPGASGPGAPHPRTQKDALNDRFEVNRLSDFLERFITVIFGNRR